jgi:replication factor C small subunit
MDGDHAMWTEKYRPFSFDEMKGHAEIISRMRGFVKQRNMPHILFSGPAGVGKTSLSLVIARELYGDQWKQNFLELNASDERGIDIVRNKVKDFARTRAIGDVPFKIIYLDESDALTRDAQQALRRTMEMYTRTTRFILSCNYSSKIIDPIQSRCAIFHFKPLKKEDVFTIVDGIAQKENLVISPEAKDALYAISSGDCRRVENILQSSAVLEKDITPEVIYSIASAARPQEVRSSLTLALKGDFMGARDTLLQTMLEHGLSGVDIIKQIQKEIWNLHVDDRKKVDLVEKCGEVEFRMTEGSDEFVQLEAFLAAVVGFGRST